MVYLKWNKALLSRILQVGFDYTNPHLVVRTNGFVSEIGDERGNMFRYFKDGFANDAPTSFAAPTAHCDVPNLRITQIDSSDDELEDAYYCGFCKFKRGGASCLTHRAQCVNPKVPERVKEALVALNKQMDDAQSQDAYTSCDYFQKDDTFDN